MFFLSKINKKIRSLAKVIIENLSGLEVVPHV